MELRHLRYFIAVAELRSVRAASEQLHVTQPAISRQIQYLEGVVGAALFERTPRGLKLTAAGEAYLIQARDIAANRMAYRIASGVQGHLSIGFVENSAWNGPVAHALGTFEQVLPDVALELQPMNTPIQLDAIAAGRLDGGFCYVVGPLPDGIATLPLMEQNVLLAVPETWQLGRTAAATAADLVGMPFVIFPRAVYPAYYDRLITACVQAGLTLQVRQEASTETAILSLVSAGVGAAIVNAANRDRPPARVRFVELDNVSVPMSLEFCYPVSSANPALRRFVEHLAKQSE